MLLKPLKSLEPLEPLDILINGGGIAGPCLAFWPTRQGHALLSSSPGGCAVPAGAGRETSGTFHRLGGHPGDAGEFVVESV